jgi:hypothetical protein
VEMQKEVTKEVVKEVTKVVEKEVTKVVEKQVTVAPVPTPTPAAAAASPTLQPTPAPTIQLTPSPTAHETAAPAATPSYAPPPPLLGQFVPETILWLPEAITDREGHLDLDIPLPDVPSVWRLTALASTRNGELGEASAQLQVGP